MKKSLLPAILFSGFIVGTADIIAACLHAYLQTGVTPDRVLRFIASGVFSRKAFVAANQSMIAWGLFFHYIIAIGFTAIFYLIYPKIKWLSANKIITGILYGIVIWGVMHFVVVPLSQTPGGRKFEWENALRAIAILTVAIGLPLSYLAARFYRRFNNDHPVASP